MTQAVRRVCWGAGVDELTLACTLGLECGPSFALFLKVGEKCEKPLPQVHLRHQEYQLDSAKMEMNSRLGENLEDLHGEYQRSARHLLNSVLGENLEDLRVAHHPAELECPRSAPQSAETRKRR